jgi:hypothetical protein
MYGGLRAELGSAEMSMLVLGCWSLPPVAYPPSREVPRAAPHRSLVTRQTLADVLLAVLSFTIAATDVL